VRRHLGRAARAAAWAVAASASVAWLAAVQQPVPAASGQLPTFRGGANLVLVDAYPRRDGRVVEGLTAADFEVFEDGRPVAIQTFEFVSVDTSVPESARRDPNTVGDMRAQAADPRSRVFVAFLDTLHATVDAGARVRGPLVNVLNQLVGPADLFGVMTPTMRASDLTLGRRLRSVDDELTRHWSWGLRERLTHDPTDPMEADLAECFHLRLTETGPEPWLVEDGGIRRHLDEVLIERRREDRTLTALENLVRHLGSLRDARSAVLPITDGWVLFERAEALVGELERDIRFVRERQQTPIPARRSRSVDPVSGLSFEGGVLQACAAELKRLVLFEHSRRLRELVTVASRNNVSFFPVATSGLAATDAGAAAALIPSASPAGQTVLGRDANRMSSRVGALRTAAEGTGGVASVNSNDIEGGLRKVVDEMSSYYLLSYEAPAGRSDGRYRRIDVRVKEPRVVVRARSGYIPVASAPAVVAAPDPARVEAESALAVLARARPGLELVTSAVADGFEMVVVAELGESFASAATVPSIVEVEVSSAAAVQAGRASGAIPIGGRAILLRAPMPPGTGPWRVTSRVVAGSRRFQDAIDVSVAAPTSVLGPPLLFRATPSLRSPLVPVASPLFRRTERVHVAWERGAAEIKTTARLLDRQGRALAGSLPVGSAAADGRQFVTVDVNLNPLPEGDYLVELTAIDGAATERSLQPFRVVR
jgi:VWFA-related protein